MTESDYADFDLEITHLPDGRYRAHVLHSPAGQGACDFERPFDDLELENLVLKMGFARTYTPRRGSTEVTAAEQLGARLFDAAFGGEVGQRFAAALDELDRQGIPGLRIQLRLAQDAAELADWPWEYLYSRDLRRFIALSVHTPLTRYADLPRRVPPLQATPPLKLLAMIANPSDFGVRLNVAEEQRLIAEALAPLERDGVLSVEWLRGGTLETLRQRLKSGPVHVFHFIGHGQWSDAEQQSALAFEDEAGRGRLVTAPQLATILCDDVPPRLVVLNACEGARTSHKDLFAGLAGALVRQRVPAVVAMQFAISDQAAITLAREFYAELGQGRPIERALAQARRAIYAEGNEVEWGVPVLYLRAESGRLFDLSAQPVPTATRLTLTTPTGPPRHGPAQPAAPQRPELKAFDWISIPAGEFGMGSDPKLDSQFYDDEKPLHRVYLPDYRIARVPVTVAQFAAFVDATGYRTTAEKQGSAFAWSGLSWEEIPGAFWRAPRGAPSDVGKKPDHPVTCVSWHDAQAFCAWAGVRLPTEAEWEKAARGPDGRIWPWGDQKPDQSRCNFNLHVGDTTPVRRYPAGASPYGVLDLAGNVWEWCSSLYQPYPYNAEDGREDLQASDSRVLRGGSFNRGEGSMRAAHRSSQFPYNRRANSGFRVALTPPQPELTRP
jgi:formylglycine-generating enzyme required for sulfatase activity